MFVCLSLRHDLVEVPGPSVCTAAVALQARHMGMHGSASHNIGAYGPNIYEANVPQSFIKRLHYPTPPNVPLLRPLWSLLDGIGGSLKGSWGVLDKTLLCGSN